MGDPLRWFARGDVRLPWGAVGREDRPVVVALPGLSDGLMPLSQTGPHVLGTARSARRLPFHVLTLSHRHPAVVGVSTRDLADDAAAFVEATVGDRVIVVGHSMGGMVAQWLAATRPDLVRHLVLTATLARPTTSFRTVLDDWEAMVVAGRWRAFAAAANEAAYTGSELLRRRLLLRLTRPPAAPHLVDRHRALTEACRTHDTSDVLGRIACPTLVLAGSEDPVVPPFASRELAEGIPGAEYEEFVGLAHGFPEQSPSRTLAAVVARLDIDGQAVA